MRVDIISYTPLLASTILSAHLIDQKSHVSVLRTTVWCNMHHIHSNHRSPSAFNLLPSLLHPFFGATRPEGMHPRKPTEPKRHKSYSHTGSYRNRHLFASRWFLPFRDMVRYQSLHFKLVQYIKPLACFILHQAFEIQLESASNDNPKEAAPLKSSTESP